MKQMIVGIDADLTAYDTLGPWLAWHKKETGGTPDMAEHVEYNLEGRLKAGHPEAYDPRGFWRNPKLYTENNVQIEPGVQEMVAKLMQAGIRVMVISACNHHHRDDKAQAVARDLPGVQFIDEHMKWKIDVDCMIDDNPLVHSGFLTKKRNGHPYQGFYHTGIVHRHFGQDSLIMPRSVIRTPSWDTIGENIINRLELRRGHTNHGVLTDYRIIA